MNDGRVRELERLLAEARLQDAAAYAMLCRLRDAVRCFLTAWDREGSLPDSATEALRVLVNVGVGEDLTPHQVEVLQRAQRIVGTTAVAP